MIAPSEIQRTSAALGVSQDVVEHDYALGCFLHFLSGDTRGSTFLDIQRWHVPGEMSLHPLSFL